MTTIGVMNEMGSGLTDWLDDAAEKAAAPLQRGNTWGSEGGQLKLSVGCADDEDSDDGCGNTDDLKERIKAWHLSNSPAIPSLEVPGVVESSQPSPSRFSAVHSDPFHSDVSAAVIDALLGDTGQRLFQPVPETNFVEEVWQEKPPKVLNGYLFGAVIGEGSYAKVKEVVEVDTLMRRAVKIFKDGRLRKIPNGTENVQRERRILCKLNHVNCIKMIEFFRLDEKNKQYMIMEFCAASLQQVLDLCDGKRLAEDRSHDFFTQLIHGVDYLHSLGIVHKDIKPGNLLLSQNATLKISDFGVAEQLSLYQDGDCCSLAQGTPKFQPPEVVSGHSSTFRGFAVDVWACAVTLYNIISGEYPFEGEVIMRLFDNIVKQPLHMPKSVELDCDAKSLLHGMLDKDPSTRLQIYQVIDHPWFRKTFLMTPFDWSSLPFRSQPSHRPLTVYSALEQMYGNQGVVIDPSSNTVTDGPLDTVSPQLDVNSPSLAPQSPSDQLETPPRNKKKSCLFSCFR